MRLLIIVFSAIWLTTPHVLASTSIPTPVIPKTPPGGIVLAPTMPQVKSSSLIDDIPRLIKTKALEHGVDPVIALTIVQNESQFSAHAVGDHGTSFGIWQIHLPAHPDITKEQAFDVEWSTDWAMKQLALGNCKIWSTCPLR